MAAVIALDDADEVASMWPVDCVAETISADASDVPVQLLAKVRESGVLGTIVHGAFDLPGVEINSILAQPCAETTRHYAEAVVGGPSKFLLLGGSRSGRRPMRNGSAKGA